MAYWSANGMPHIQYLCYFGGDFWSGWLSKKRGFLLGLRIFYSNFTHSKKTGRSVLDFQYFNALSLRFAGLFIWRQYISTVRYQFFMEGSDLPYTNKENASYDVQNPRSIVHYIQNKMRAVLQLFMKRRVHFATTSQILVFLIIIVTRSDCQV